MMDRWRNNTWLRRAVFLGGNLTAGLALVGLFVLPVHDFFADREAQIAERRALLSRLEGIGAQQTSVQALVRRAEAAPQQSEFLAGANEGVANADLQTRLKAIAQAAGARLRSVRALPARTNQQVKFIGAQIEISGALRAIHQTVHAVENAKPYLFVAAAVIKPALQTSRPGNPEEPILDAQLDVIGAVQLTGRE